MPTNNKRPSEEDKNIEIKQFGSWTTSQINNYNNKKNIMKNENILYQWENFIKKYQQYFLTNQEQ